MQQEIKELKLDSEGRDTAAVSSQPTNSNAPGALAGEGGQGQSTPDLLAGSSHSRVIKR